jgi:hypothetical protein
MLTTRKLLENDSGDRDTRGKNNYILNFDTVGIQYF